MSERRSGVRTLEADGIQLLRRVEGGEQTGAVTETEKKRETILVDSQISSFLAARDLPYPCFAIIPPYQLVTFHLLFGSSRSRKNFIFYNNIKEKLTEK